MYEACCLKKRRKTCVSEALVALLKNGILFLDGRGGSLRNLLVRARVVGYLCYFIPYFFPYGVLEGWILRTFKCIGYLAHFNVFVLGGEVLIYLICFSINFSRWLMLAPVSASLVQPLVEFSTADS